MSEKSDKRQQDFPRPRRDATLSTPALARFLKRLAAVYRDPVTGNPPLSEALAELASALAKYSSLPVKEAASEISTHPRSRHRSQDLGRSWKDLELQEAKRMLSSEAVDRADLIRLGAVRFAISRSRLERLSKAEIAQTIWSAVRHEESLSIISDEARRDGTDRS